MVRSTRSRGPMTRECINVSVAQTQTYLQESERFANTKIHLQFLLVDAGADYHWRGKTLHLLLVHMCLYCIGARTGTRHRVRLCQRRLSYRRAHFRYNRR